MLYKSLGHGGNGGNGGNDVVRNILHQALIMRRDVEFSASNVLVNRSIEIKTRELLKLAPADFASLFRSLRRNVLVQLMCKHLQDSPEIQRNVGKRARLAS